MRVKSLPASGILVLVFLLSGSFFLGCSSEKKPEKTETKPVVQEMNIEAPADENKIPMN